MISGFHHVAIKYENGEMFEQAISFYCGILGFEEVLHWGEGERRAILLRSGDAVMELFASGRKAGTTGSINHLTFATADVDGMIEKVRAAGYSINVEPKDVILGSEGQMPARVAFCTGPGGEEIEFFYEK